MKTWLYLTAAGLGAPSADWPCCMWSSTGERRYLPLREASRELHGQAVDVLLPMEMCNRFRSEPWPSRRQPRPQAVAFAIEEQLAQDPESVHVCIGRRDSEQRYPVMVIELVRFQALMALLRVQAIEVRAVHVDADLLPQDYAYGLRWFDRWLLGGALPARVSLSTEALEMLRAGLPKDLRWRDEEQDRPGIDEWLLRASGQPVDLLQGAFRRRRPVLPWRGVAAALSGILLLSGVFSEARIRFLESEAQNLQARSEQRFRDLYPEQNRIVDLAAQFQALHNQRGRQQDTQIARLVRLTEQVMGASSVEVQRIDFRPDEGLKIRLTANSFFELEQLRERGRQSGMPLTLGSASKQGARVQATLTLENRG